MQIRGAPTTARRPVWGRRFLPLDEHDQLPWEFITGISHERCAEYAPSLRKRLGRLTIFAELRLVRITANLEGVNGIPSTVTHFQEHRQEAIAR